MSIHFYAITDIGMIRKRNEDTFLIDKNLGLAIIADGMGGHANGHIASTTAAAIVQDSLQKQASSYQDAPPPNFNKAITEANTNLWNQSFQSAVKRGDILATEKNPHLRRSMGTTLTAMVLRGSLGWFGHVGDSRLYQYRGNILNQMTTDHEDGWSGALTRAVGTDPEVNVDTEVWKTQQGDLYLLCTDGFFYLDNIQISHCMKKMAVEIQKSGDHATVINAHLNELITNINAIGGRDNTTLVVGYIS